VNRIPPHNPDYDSDLYGSAAADAEDAPTCPDCGLLFATPFALAAHACEVRIRRDVRLGAAIVAVALVLSALFLAALLEA
jgi:hypothetical protein